MPTSNRIEDLHPDLVRVYEEAKAAYIKAHPAGLRPRLGETYRPANVQYAYHAQGRKSLIEINQLRHAAGLSPIGATEGKRIITNALPGQSAHGFLPARAFDVQLVRPDGSIDWAEEAYLGFAVFVQAAAHKLGVAISQGAYWNFKDYPHTELLQWKTMHKPHSFTSKETRMKTFNLLAIAALVIAAAGICFDYHRTGGATWLSYVGCVPLAVWVGVLLVHAVRGK